MIHGGYHFALQNDILAWCDLAFTICTKSCCVEDAILLYASFLQHDLARMVRVSSCCVKDAVLICRMSRYVLSGIPGGNRSLKWGCAGKKFGNHLYPLTKALTI